MQSPPLNTSSDSHRSLAEWFASPVKTPSAALVAAALVEAVSTLHAGKTFHGYLNPLTVRLDGEGRVYFTTQLPTAATLPPAPNGPWELYLAPEQLRGKPASQLSDLFCLGLLLAKITTQQHPFAASSRGEAMAAILFRPPLADHLPSVQAYLAKVPKHRRRSPALPLQPLISAPAAVATSHSQRRRQSTKPGLWVALTLLVSLGVFGMQQWQHRQQTLAIATEANHERRRGDDACRRREVHACTQGYMAAFALRPVLASDPEILSNLLAFFDPKAALGKGAIRDLAPTLTQIGATATAALAERTRRGTTTQRWNAARVLEAMGQKESVDYVAIYSEDLRRGDCEHRREAVHNLAQLNDRRAVEPLKREAQAVQASLLERFCVGRAAQEAAAKLERRR